MLMAGTLRAEATLALANGLFLVLLLLGGVVLPLDHLPGLLAGSPRSCPAAALSDALRIGLGAAPADPVGPLAVLAGLGPSDHHSCSPRTVPLGLKRRAIGLAVPGPLTSGQGRTPGGRDPGFGSRVLVAGDGFEPPTFGL